MDVTDRPYSNAFYNANARNSTKAALPVLQLLRDLYAPESIVDIGCGSGAWLTVAGSLGFTTLRGYDGPWADPSAYTSPDIDFVAVDLEKSGIEHPQRYDLAMSVEVAEHLSEPRADVIVDALCAASDVVLFGAALRNQGGLHHVNEQPQSYWVEKFRRRGYEPYDVVRPVIWDNPDVKAWFKQNTLLYVKSGSAVLDPEQLHSMERPIWDLVHPEHYERKLRTARAKIGDARRLETRVEKLRERNATLKTQLAATRAEGQSLRRRLAEEQARRTPLRAAAGKVWRRLPPSARAAVRPTRST